MKLHNALVLVPGAFLVFALFACGGGEVTSGGDGGGEGTEQDGSGARDTGVHADGGGADAGPKDAGGGDAGPGDGGDAGGPDGGCVDGCPALGVKECSGANAYRACGHGEDGCLEWSAPVACDDGVECKDGVCQVKCPNQQCTTTGAKKCLDISETVECGDFNDDGCHEWGNPESCGQNLVCSNGACAADCKNECTASGVRKCDGNYIVVCGDNGAGCLVWANPIACGAKDCSNGVCLEVCEDECTAAGSRICDGSGYRTCEDYDRDGCLELGSTLQCPQGQVCSNGQCADTCKDECTVLNAKKCVLDSVAVCDDYNDDGCLEWGTAVPCDEGLVCGNGYCESTCESECTVAKAKKCDEGGNVVVCDDYDGMGCLKWGSPTPCNSPLVCAGGVCTQSCADGCPFKNAKQCVVSTTDQYQVCDDYNSDGCLEWGSAQTCTDPLVCSSGNCALTCTDECTVNNSRECVRVTDSYHICGDYNADTCLEWGTTVPCEVFETCEGGLCKQKQPPATVLIAEVVYDPAAGTSDLFTELHGPAGTDLAGYTLVGVKGSDGTDYNAIALAGAIGQDGYYVVAHPSASQAVKDKADLLDAKGDWHDGPDSIQVRYGVVVVDALGYGNFGGAIFAGEGTASAGVAAGHSLGRDQNNTDTDNNAVDFKDYAAPSPGAQNLAANQPPTAALVCPPSGNAGQSLAFSASGSSDPDGAIVTYEFDWADGTPKTTGASATANHTFNAGGTFTVVLTVTDNGGATDTDTCQVAITDPTSPSVVLIKPTDNKQVTQGENVQVLADATPTSGRTISKVELVIDGVVTGTPDVAAPYEFTYQVPAQAVTGSTIDVHAKATDSAGSAGLSPISHLKVKNDPPVASFTAIVTGALKVTLDASGSYDTETATADLEVRWDFDNNGSWDTTWSTDKVVVDRPYAEGTHTIKCEVRDAVAQTNTTTRTVTVSMSQTISGTVTTTTWTGIVVITGDTVVPASNTLTIAAGTQIQFMYVDQNTDGVGDYDLTINGTLDVNGSASEPVIFTVYGNTEKHPKAWNGIILSGTGSTIDHAVVEYADIGLDIRDNTTTGNVQVRNSTTGIKVTSPANTTWTTCTVNDNTGNGIELAGGTVNATGCVVRDNGGDGAYATGGTLNFAEGIVRNNGKAGLEYYGGGVGLVQKNLVTQNALEGFRITTDGANDPNPVINYNNIYGNATVSGRVVDDVEISVATTAGNYGTYNSGTWQTPNGETIDWVHADYDETDYNGNVSGYVRKETGAGANMWSSNGDLVRWANVTAHAATKILGQVVDYDYSYYGTMIIHKAAYQKTGAGIEASVISNSGTVDMKHNFFGVFPDMLSAVSIGRPAAANLQGFVGAAFDGTWSKGPYHGGEALGAATTDWSGTIYVTGDVTVGSGKTLNVVEGASVLFARIDQDKNGVGDYSILVNGGTFNVTGTSPSKVFFSQYGAVKAKKAWSEVKVYGGATCSISWATFEYGNTGLRVESGGHMIANATARENGLHGFHFAGGATLATANFLTADANDGDGVRVENYSNLAFDHLTSTNNAARGVFFSGSNTDLTLGHSTITNNGGAGVHLLDSTVGMDHNNINYNGQGIVYEGNAKGAFTYNNVKYNDLEGIYLRSTASQNPSPVINNNNVYGNSVAEGGVVGTPNLSQATNAGMYGAYYTAAWSTPAAQTIRHIYVQYSETDYNGNVSGYVRKDDDAGTVLFSNSSSYGPKFVDVAAHGAISIVAGVVDYDYSYYGTTSVTGAFYYAASQLTEIVALTDGGTVDCKNNYWGVAPPSPRFALGRSDAIDFQGFQLNEIGGTGP